MRVGVEEGLLSAATDADSDPLRVQGIVNGPQNGDVSFYPDGRFTYQVLEPGYTGPDSFSFTVTDGRTTSEAATVQLTVTNAAPVATDTEFWVRHGRTLTDSLAGGVYDPDGDPVEYWLLLPPSLGGVTVNRDGSFTYQPSNPNTVGTDSFIYFVTDGTAISEFRTATVNLTNLPPELGRVNLYWRNAPATFFLGQLATDPDGDTLELVSFSEPAYGVIYEKGVGRYNYLWNAAAPEYGWDSFTYTVTDGIEQRTGTVRVYADRSADNRYVPAHFGSEFYVRANETEQDNNVLTASALQDAVTVRPVRVERRSDPQCGTILSFDQSAGTFQYKPSVGCVGLVYFSVVVIDTVTGFESNQGQMNIHVVKPDLQVGGVAAGEKLNPGAFITVNGDVVPGTAHKNGVPEQASLDFYNHQTGSPHLRRVDLPVPAGAPPGRGLVRVYISPQDGRVQMWNNNRKSRFFGQNWIFNVAQLPTTFYLEGRDNSDALRDVQLIARYESGNPVGSDVVNLTVTPVVGNLTMNSDTVEFFDSDGYRGMRTPALAVQVDILAAGGGIARMELILVVTGVDNGLGGGSAIVPRDGLGLAPRNVVITPGGPNFPVLLNDTWDSYYWTSLWVPQANQLLSTFTPFSFPPYKHVQMDRIAVRTNFEFVLVARYATNAYFTVAKKPFSATFSGDMNLTRVRPESNVDVTTRWSKTHIYPPTDTQWAHSTWRRVAVLR